MAARGAGGARSPRGRARRAGWRSRSTLALSLLWLPALREASARARRCAARSSRAWQTGAALAGGRARRCSAGAGWRCSGATLGAAGATRGRLADWLGLPALIDRAVVAPVARSPALRARRASIDARRAPSTRAAAVRRAVVAAVPLYAAPAALSPPARRLDAASVDRGVPRRRAALAQRAGAAPAAGSAKPLADGLPRWPGAAWSRQAGARRAPAADRPVRTSSRSPSIAVGAASPSLLTAPAELEPDHADPDRAAPAARRARSLLLARTLERGGAPRSRSPARSRCCRCCCWSRRGPASTPAPRRARSSTSRSCRGSRRSASAGGSASTASRSRSR